MIYAVYSHFSLNATGFNYRSIIVTQANPTHYAFGLIVLLPIFFPLKAPSQLKSLDDLMMQASHYAEFCMRSSGSMPPTLFLIGNDGPMMFLPEKLADDDDKDEFATTARLICIAHNAQACVLALEAWIKTAKENEKLDMTEPPSEAIDRQEVIVLMGEDRNRQNQQFLPIIRSDNGKFFNLNESELPTMDNMKGRFAQILSPKIPDERMQTLTKALLGVKQVKAVRIGKPVRR